MRYEMDSLLTIAENMKAEGRLLSEAMIFSASDEEAASLTKAHGRAMASHIAYLEIECSDLREQIEALRRAGR